MRFTYEYRTSDNVRHEGVVEASDREAAFRKLREQGVRPGRLEEAPGFFNKFFGRCKRWTAIAVLGVLCVVISVVSVRALRTTENARNDALYSPLTRRQIYGDPALMEDFARTDYAALFETQADRFLACYAQPATAHRFAPRLSATLSRQAAVGAALSDLVAKNYEPPIRFVEGESREARELKRIVRWMRGELKDYLSDGSGTPFTYATRLEERQEQELALFWRIRNELSRTDDAEAWEDGNRQLRAIGAPTLTKPPSRARP